MKAPIPDRESFWWNDTAGLCKQYPPYYDMKQAEPWWTDEDLDRKAQLLRRQHIALRRSSPYFMETEIKDYTETNEDGKWLNDAEIAKLMDTELFTVNYVLNGQAYKETIPKALLVSFSRLGKESNLLYKLGGNPFVVDNWQAFLSTWWIKGYTKGTLCKMESLPEEEQMGSAGLFMKASRVFFRWMWSGKIDVVDEEVTKEYLLRLARALGAPLFRADVLSQL